MLGFEKFLAQFPTSVNAALASSTTAATFFSILVLWAQLRTTELNTQASLVASQVAQGQIDKQFQATSAQAVRSGALTPNGQNVRGENGAIIGPMSGYSALRWGTLPPRGVTADIGNIRQNFVNIELTPSGGANFTITPSSTPVRKLKNFDLPPSPMREGLPLRDARLLVTHMEALMTRSGCTKAESSTSPKPSDCDCLDRLRQMATNWIKAKESARVTPGSGTSGKSQEEATTYNRARELLTNEGSQKHRAMGRKMLLPP